MNNLENQQDKEVNNYYKKRVKDKWNNAREF